VKVNEETPFVLACVPSIHVEYLREKKWMG
jgi:hypothetical protein